MLGVVVHSPCVENHDSVFGDEVVLVREIFARDVRSTEPKGVVTALDLWSCYQHRLLGSKGFGLWVKGR